MAAGAVPAYAEYDSITAESFPEEELSGLIDSLAVVVLEAVRIINGKTYYDPVNRIDLAFPER